MTREDTENYLRLLGQELQKKGVTGEVLVGSGMIVLLDIKKPEIPDIDAYFSNTTEFENINAYFGGHGATLRQAIKTIATHEGLSYDWVAVAIKEIFYTDTHLAYRGWLEYPNLRIYLASPSHLLAMQVATAVDVQDIEKLQKLAAMLHLSTMRAALPYVKEYVPNKLLTSEMKHSLKQALKLWRRQHKAQVK